ncbi:MAG: hypothetical protein M1819_001623 [Sarea resinae]|nr:MAG: hypothetical protein M1819_001623 [Sarea resinae]
MAEVTHTTGKEWDKVAPVFFDGLAESPTDAPTAAMITALDNAYPLSQATTIMDNGCGTGPGTTMLIQKCASMLPAGGVRILATDFSAGMVEQVTEQRINGLKDNNKLWEQVETKVLDAHDLAGVEDGSISHMMAGFVFFMVADPQKALQEARRVLTPDNGGGVLAQTSWQGSEWLDLLGLVKVVAPHAQLPQMPEAWTTTAGVREQLEKAGFRDVEAREVRAHLAFDDPVTTVNFFVRRLPLMAKVRAGLTADEIDRTCELMIQHLREKYTQLPGRMVGTAILGVGRK